MERRQIQAKWYWSIFWPIASRSSYYSKGKNSEKNLLFSRNPIKNALISQGRLASDKKIFKGSLALLELIFVPNFCRNTLLMWLQKSHEIAQKKKKRIIEGGLTAPPLPRCQPPPLSRLASLDKPSLPPPRKIWNDAPDSYIDFSYFWQSRKCYGIWKFLKTNFRDLGSSDQRVCIQQCVGDCQSVWVYEKVCEWECMRVSVRECAWETVREILLSRVYGKYKLLLGLVLDSTRVNCEKRNLFQSFLVKCEWIYRP